MKPFKYVTVTPRDREWGLSVSSVGTQTVAAGMPYPPSGHAREYIFNPSKGRILKEYQLLYIVEGGGTLETASAGRKAIKSGDMFLLFPGEWHSYAPDPATGWKEYWIGFSGHNIDQRVAQGFFSASSPVYDIGYNASAVSLYQEAIRAATEQAASFQLLLAGIVNHLLGLMSMVSRNRSLSPESGIASMVSAARSYMSEHMEEDLQIPDLASILNVSYTSFRRSFKEYTGIAPGQYLINLRMHKAKDLLRGTGLSVKEISYRLQFESPEYFSTRFKKHTGVTPSEFRER